MLLTGIGLVSLILAVVTMLALEFSLYWIIGLFVGYYLLLALIAFGFLWAVCAVVKLEEEQTEDNKFYRTVMGLYIDALRTVLMIRVCPQGMEKLPKDGRFVLVCNHLFLADPALLLNVFPKAQLAFITKKENQQMFLVGKIMHKILCQPLDRENDRAALKTILKCIQLIKEDKVSIGVFPEGYTSKDGKLHPFRAGVFKIAQKANVPIVVCTIRNTRSIFKNLKKLKPTHIPLHLVDVIPAEELKSKTTVEISDMVYEMMISDLGEEVRYTEA